MGYRVYALAATIAAFISGAAVCAEGDVRPLDREKKINDRTVDKKMVFYGPDELKTMYHPVAKSYVVVPTSVIELGNMPPVMDQGSFSLCYAYAATVLAQREWCKAAKADCTNLPPEHRISPLSMAAFSPQHDVLTGGYSLLGGGGNLMALYVAQSQFPRLYTEACYDSNKYLEVFASTSNVEEKRRKLEFLVGKLRVEYEKHKAGEAACNECIRTFFHEIFKVSPENEGIQGALKATQFEKFLFRLLFPTTCFNKRMGGYSPDETSPRPFDMAKWTTGPRMGCYPNSRSSGVFVSVEDVINAVKERLRNDVAVAIQTCAYIVEEECIGFHPLVISGYRQACNPKGECRHVLRVQNSWGEAWQKMNDGGWLDAHKLLDHVPRGECTLVWVR